MLRPETIEIQHKLASYCRTGDSVVLPGARNDKLHHYRRLVFNVVKGTIDQAFPISKEIIDGDVWYNMVDRFFREHDCQTPKIWLLPLEFYEFIKAAGFASKLEMPYLNDLLYFEWIEIEVHTMPDEEIPWVSDGGNLIQDPLLVNPEHRIIHLEYPVHKVSGSDSESQRGNYFVMAYREPETGRVRFMDLSILHVFVLNKILLEEKPVSNYIAGVADQFNITDKDLIINNLTAFLNEMMDRKAILGFTKA